MVCKAGLTNLIEVITKVGLTNLIEVVTKVGLMTVIVFDIQYYRYVIGLSIIN